MRKSVCLFFLVLVVSGCMRDKDKKIREKIENTPQPIRIGLPQPTGGYVLSVQGEAITSEEIINPVIENMRSYARSTTLVDFKRQAHSDIRRIVSNKVSNILLYKEAQKEAGDNVSDALEKAVEAEVRKFIQDHDGDTAKAEQKLKEDGMTWESFKEYQNRLILTQSYIQKMLPKEQPVTHSDLVEYYNRIKETEYTTPASIKFQLIDIQPEKLEVNDAGGSQLDRAREIAGDLIKRLNAGEDFGDLARQYSHGHRAIFGGEWQKIQPDSLAKPYDILAEEAQKTPVGQITDPIETGDHIFIMKVLQKQLASVQPFESVQKEIENKVSSEPRRKAFMEIESKLIQDAAINDIDDFVEFC
ncbi:MAG: peptidylprolyl isomerase, partial [Planctomycetota bacterium]